MKRVAFKIQGLDCAEEVAALRRIVGPVVGGVDYLSCDILNGTAELLPADKVKVIEDLRHMYGDIAMVGDGVNDAPAMAAATLGIAMGGIGTAAAMEAADITLMSDDLTRLAWLISHARRTLRVIQQNICCALGLKLICIILAVAGVATLWMAIAADMGASLLVIFNGLRLTKQ